MTVRPVSAVQHTGVNCTTRELLEGLCYIAIKGLLVMAICGITILCWFLLVELNAMSLGEVSNTMVKLP